MMKKFNRFNKSGRVSAALALLAALSAGQAGAAALQAYNVDPASVSVSGLSSGGFMAAQLGMAYSSVFQTGFGVFAGGPYDCARNQSYSSCMYNATPSITTPNSNINSWSGTSKMDSVSNLANRKIYLWTGTSDYTVGQNVMNQLKSQLSNYYNSNNFSYITSSGAAHTFPTDFDGTGNNSCSSTSSPYISNCSYDGAGAVLKWMYGTLNSRNTGTLGGSVLSFDQSSYLSTSYAMASTGYLYVPANCAAGQACKLHVALHGCVQNYEKISDKFINNTGYNKWADTNNIIVLYPQTTVDNTSHSTPGSGTVSNPNACWDWIGWYGSDFDQKGGKHAAALVAMVNKVTSGYSGGSTTTTTTGATTTTTGAGTTTTTAAATSTTTAAVTTTTTTATTTTTTAGACYKSSNYAHVTAGRAYNSLGYAKANGSNQSMGLYNTFVTTKLRKTGTNYYVIDNTCP